MAKPPAKKQRAISSFFTPAASKPLLPSPLPISASVDDSTKRKLELFSHQQATPETTTPTKKPRVENDGKQLEKINIVKPSDVSPRKTRPTRTKLTPLENQFIDLKRANMDKVLAVQVGYKFKFYGHDAVVASQLLNIMLIRGNLDLDEKTFDRFAYCSIPDNRLHIHLQRLLNAGLKVGVVKQTETAAIKQVESSNKLGLFERKVTGVYTRATYMGDELLTGDPTINRSHNIDNSSENTTYILCVNESHAKNTSILAVQPLTGDIVYDEFQDTPTRDELDTRLLYLKPSEVVVVGNGEKVSVETSKTLRLSNSAVTITYKKARKQSEVAADLTDFFAAIDEDNRSAHLADHYMRLYSPELQCCISELVSYLSEFKLSNVFTIPSNFSSLTDSHKYMLLPGTTLKALDVFEVQEEPGSRKGTLLWLLDHAHTKKGSRLMRKWISRPLVNKQEIEERLAAVETLKMGNFVHVVDALRQAIVKSGKSGIDLDKLLIKAHYSATYLSGKISRKEMFLMLKNFLDVLDVSRSFGTKGIEEFRVSNSSKLILHILHNLHELSEDPVVTDLLDMINASAALNDTNLNDQRIQFFNLRNEKFDSVAAELEQIALVESNLDIELEEIRGFLKRPQLQFVTNLKDTHLIEVRNGKAVDSLPSDWLKISGTKSVSRFRTPKVSSLHKQLQYHNDMVLKASDECFNNFLKEVDSHYEYFHKIVANMANFDCLLALSSAAENGYVRPNLLDEQLIHLKLASHPILAKTSNGNYVPNDVDISYDKDRVLIITGPNMGGKSSYVKQIALLAIMTQIGCLLPCSSATMGIFDSIFIRMGASDNILKGKSTFMVEMLEASNVVKNYTPKSLIILDEIGRGTGTSDGIALAYSILRYIIEDPKKPLTLFITHYPSLHVLEELEGVRNFHMAFIEKTNSEGNKNEWPEVIFLYKLVSGVVSNLYGLNVAKLAGIDQKIIENAFRVSELMKSEIERARLLHCLGKLTRENAAETLLELSNI